MEFGIGVLLGLLAVAVTVTPGISNGSVAAFTWVVTLLYASWLFTRHRIEILEFIRANQGWTTFSCALLAAVVAGGIWVNFVLPAAKQGIGSAAHPTSHDTNMRLVLHDALFSKVAGMANGPNGAEHSRLIVQFKVESDNPVGILANQIWFIDQRLNKKPNRLSSPDLANPIAPSSPPLSIATPPMWLGKNEPPIFVVWTYRLRDSVTGVEKSDALWLTWAGSDKDGFAFASLAHATTTDVERIGVYAKQYDAGLASVATDRTTITEHPAEVRPAEREAGDRPFVLIEELSAEQIRAITLSDARNRVQPEGAYARGWITAKASNRDVFMYATRETSGKAPARNIRYYPKVSILGKNGSETRVAIDPETPTNEVLLPGQQGRRQILMPTGTLFTAPAASDGRVRITLVATYQMQPEDAKVYFYKIVLSAPQQFLPGQFSVNAFTTELTDDGLVTDLASLTR